MAAAIASGLIRQKRQAREQHIDRPSTNRRRKSPNKNKGLCNGNLVDIFSKVRIFGLRKRRLRRQGVGSSVHKKSMLCLMSWDNIRPHFIFTFSSDKQGTHGLELLFILTRISDRVCIDLCCVLTDFFDSLFLFPSYCKSVFFLTQIVKYVVRTVSNETTYSD